jgi:glycosyltransferase involved in cell wall biosynthesis
MDVSVVVPAYNEEGTIKELAGRVLDIFAQNSYSGEIIFVNDGSTDETTKHCNDLAREHENITHIHFHRNKGKAAGLQAGFDAAKGNYVITMDADLQDDPKEIPALIEKLKEGWDIVSGWKKKRHDPITKRWPSKLFNWAARVMSGIKIHDFNCGLKGYRNEVTKTVKLYGEMHRWIPVLGKVEGFKTTEIVVTHHPRTANTVSVVRSKDFLTL